MAKKKYTTVWMDLDPSGEDIIPLDPSQGTSGDDPQFTWDPNIDPDDIEMLEDLIMAATNEAYRKMEEEASAAMSKLTGGFGGLGGFGL